MESSDVKSASGGCDDNDSAEAVNPFRPRLEGVHKARESLHNGPAGWIFKRGAVNVIIVVLVSRGTLFHAPEKSIAHPRFSQLSKNDEC